MRSPDGSRALAVLAGVLLVLAGCGAQSDPEGSPPAPVPEQQVLAGAELREKDCPTSVEEPFEPAAISVEGVEDDVAVVYPPRASPDVPGTPPTDAAGKQLFAFDRDTGIEAGAERGNALLNAHTFPDGSALGNRLLDGLEEGGRIVLAGDGQTLCYRVTDRVEVDAYEPFFRYYETDGPHQIAIVVCSGDRLGPGVWTERTVWFAEPAA